MLEKRALRIIMGWNRHVHPSWYYWECILKRLECAHRCILSTHVIDGEEAEQRKTYYSTSLLHPV